MIHDGRAPQEPLGLLGLVGQRLAVEVVGDVPVVTGDRQRLAAIGPRDQRREVEADRPTLGPFRHGGGQLVIEADARFREDLRGAGRVEGQVGRDELERVSRSAKSRQVRLLRTTCRDQLRASGNPRHDHAQHIVTVRRLELVEVVEHEHERHGTRSGRSDASRGAARPNTDTPSPLISATKSALSGEIRAYADANRTSRIAGSSSKRSSDTHPTGRSSACAHSVRNVDFPYPAGAVTPTTRQSLARARLDEVGATHRTRARLRNRELGVEEYVVELEDPALAPPASLFTGGV